jgi:hypothetical protein
MPGIAWRGLVQFLTAHPAHRLLVKMVWREAMEQTFYLTFERLPGVNPTFVSPAAQFGMNREFCGGRSAVLLWG